MKILVTGSSGFIGCNLIKQLKEQHTIIEADIAIGTDLCDKKLVDDLPDVDMIYHLAMINNTGRFYTNPYDIIENSYLPLHNILKRYKGIPIIYTSSSEAYAGTVQQKWAEVPTSENVLLSIEDIKNPRWSYGASKIIGESMVVAANVQWGTPYKIIRYHNIYGPDQKNHFIPEFIERCLTGVYELYGYDNTRSFCYIDDAINATMLYAESTTWNDIIHIGNNTEHKIEDIAKMILHIMGIDAKIILYPSPIGSVLRRCPDITKLKQLGYTPQYTLEEGLKKILEINYGINGK